MKKLFSTLLIGLISLSVFAQVPDRTVTNPVPLSGVNKNKQSDRYSNITAVNNLRIPVSSTFTLNNAKDSVGYVMFNSTTKQFGVYKGNGMWDVMSTVADGLISVGDITVTGNTLTIVAPVYWRVNSTNQQKLTNTVFNIPFATEGYNRIDLIYATSVGTILKIQGTETIGVAVEPVLPINSIKVASVYITGSQIQQPIPDLGDYATIGYVDENFVKINPLTPQSGNIDVIGSVRVTNSVTSQSARLAGNRLTIKDFELDVHGTSSQVSYSSIANHIFNTNGVSRFEIKNDGTLLVLTTPTTDTSPTQLLTRDASTGEIRSMGLGNFAKQRAEVKTNFNNTRENGIYTIEGGNDDVVNAPVPTVHSWSLIQADSGIPNRTMQIAVDNFNGSLYSRASNGTWKGYVELSPSSAQNGNIWINGEGNFFGLRNRNSLIFDNTANNTQNILYRNLISSYDILNYNSTSRVLSWKGTQLATVEDIRDSISNVVATVNNIADLRAYNGVATSINVKDNLRGGVFVYDNTGAYTTNNGTKIQAIGKGGGVWLRQFSGPIDVKWFEARPFNPLTENNITGFDSSPAINDAIKSLDRRNGQILISDNFLIKSPIELGEGTNITGLSRVFPYQLDSVSNPPNIDTIKYANKSALWALNNTDALVTTLDTVSYRNQGIKIANIGIYGTGKNNGKSGILLRDNPNSSMTIKRPGLIQLDNVAIANFTTLADGRNSADSWYITGQSHFSDAKFGIRSGVYDLRLHQAVVYNIDSIGVELNGSYNVVTANEIEVGTDSTTVGFKVNGWGSIISDNIIKNTGKGIVVAPTAIGTNISSNNIFARWRGLILESGSGTTSVKSNIFGSMSVLFPSTAELLFVEDKGSVFSNFDGNTFRKQGGAQLKPAHFYNASNLTFGFNQVGGFTLPDARAFTFSGANTFNRQTTFSDLNINGRLTVGNGLLTSGSLNQFSDNNTGLASFYKRTYGVNALNLTQRFNGTESAPTTLTNGTILEEWRHTGYNGVSLSGDRAKYRIEANGDWTTGNSATRFVWSATPNGSNAMVDKLSLDGNGLNLVSGRMGFNGSFGSAGEALRNNSSNTGLEFYTPSFISDSITVPTPTSTGVKGEIRYIGSFKYECIATNTWVRVAVDTTWP